MMPSENIRNALAMIGAVTVAWQLLLHEWCENTDRATDVRELHNKIANEWTKILEDSTGRGFVIIPDISNDVIQIRVQENGRIRAAIIHPDGDISRPLTPVLGVDETLQEVNKGYPTTKRSPIQTLPSSQE